MKNLRLLACLLAMSITKCALAQNIGISSTGATPDLSAMLDINTTSKGMLTPRMTTTQQNAIVSPANGLLIYNTTANAFMVNAGTAAAPNWVLVGNAVTGWSTTGNTGTSAANFLGTTDNKSMRIRTKNLMRMMIDSSNGNVGIGNDVFDVSNAEKMLVDAGTTTSVNAIYARGSINNYFQFNIRNTSSGTQATSDIVATANNGTETSNFVDLGINGGSYVYANGNPIETGKSNDGYLISSGNDFYVVNNNASKSMLFLTGGTSMSNERMRIQSNGRIGIGVTDPAAQFVVKDTMEIRRTGALSQLLFTNTSGSGDFRIGGDGGDIYWQGGGSRCLQMGSYWTTILGGDRQNAGFPSYVGSVGGTGVLVQSQRDGSVPLAIQSYSSGQSSNLTEWRNESGTVLGSVTKNGAIAIGTNAAPNSVLQIGGSLSTPVVTQTATYTVTSADYTIICNNSSAITINLPTASGIDGRIYVIKKVSGAGGNVTIDGSGTQKIDGATAKVLSTQYEVVQIQSDGYNWFIL
jgi:hypothetical protein